MKSISVKIGNAVIKQTLLTYYFPIRSMLSHYYIPLGMYRSVENEAPPSLRIP
ncbi:MAG: hypothetical protein LBQ66_02735 [Planctomycetaceae bacterium]|nr:hypothetical protein [Planctomycetaceae bacterium]